MIMGVDIIGHGVDPFRDFIIHLLFLIGIAVLKQSKAVEKADKETVQHQFLSAGKLPCGKGRIGLSLKGKAYDLVDQVGENAQLFFGETVNGNLLVKGDKKLLKSVLKAEAVFRKHEVDDQTL